MGPLKLKITIFTLKKEKKTSGQGGRGINLICQKYFSKSLNYQIVFDPTENSGWAS